MTDKIADFLPPPFLYKKNEFVVSEETPWENDRLNRKEQAEKLTNILEPVEQPIVMTLSAPYGMGKTTFLKCWQQDLKINNVASVIFNAWETDYSDDAFIAFVASMERQILNENKVKTKFISAAKSVAGAIMKNAPSFAVKVVAKATIGESGVKALENFELSEDDAVKLVESIAGDTFKAQVATENAIANFRKTFAEIIEKHCGGRLFIFVDELDRCRPNYSVELLERIKHIFSVKGAVFVLAVDRQQLLSSISGVYGSKIDAELYFRKFSDWDYDLPTPSHFQYCSHLYYNVFSLDKQKMLPKGGDFRDGATPFLQILSLFSEVYKVSLRDLDQYFTYLNLIWQMKPKNCYPIEIALAAFMKNTKKLEFEKIINWVPKGTYTQSPIQEKIFEIIQKVKKNGSLSSSDYILISSIIFLFSHSASQPADIRVCVSDNFLNIAIPNQDYITNSWILDRLKKSHFDNAIPSIQNGLVQLNKLNI